MIDKKLRNVLSDMEIIQCYGSGSVEKGKIIDKDLRDSRWRQQTSSRPDRHRSRAAP